MRQLIQQISISNEILDMSWNWVYYGDGEASLIESKSNVELPAQDSRLYSIYKALFVKMVAISYIKQGKL